MTVQQLLLMILFECVPAHAALPVCMRLCAHVTYVSTQMWLCVLSTLVLMKDDGCQPRSGVSARLCPKGKGGEL